MLTEYCRQLEHENKRLRERIRNDALGRFLRLAFLPLSAALWIGIIALWRSL